MSRFSNQTYNDNIECSEQHFNSMRSNPVYPAAVIENNVTQLRPFPNNWLETQKMDVKVRNLSKRCLFNATELNRNLHLASLSSLTNEHLLDRGIRWPFEDDVYRRIGQKRRIVDGRNGLEERSPGDKSYREVDYSADFYSRKSRNWRSEKYELPRRSAQSDVDTISDELLSRLVQPGGVSRSAHLFNNVFNYNYDRDLRMFNSSFLKNEDAHSVSELDSWKPAAKLEMPFRVLDINDKNFKYRPKVTR